MEKQETLNNLNVKDSRNDIIKEQILIIREKLLVLLKAQTLVPGQSMAMAMDTSEMNNVTDIVTREIGINTPLSELEIEGVTPVTLLSELEIEWLDDDCIRRFYEACKGDVKLTSQRLFNTLNWRREYKPHLITFDDIKQEALTGKEFIKGFDRNGKPILYLVPARENTKNHENQLRFVVYTLETGIRKFMAKGIESFTIVVDYNGVSIMNSPPLSVSKKFLQIVGDHYPQRLGNAFIYNPSWYIWVFFKLLRPFMDPVTASKINLVDPESEKRAKKRKADEVAATVGFAGYVDSITKYIDPDQLLVEYGGNVDWKFNFDDYQQIMEPTL